MLTVATLKSMTPIQEWVGDAQNYSIQELCKLIGWKSAFREVMEHRANELDHNLQQSKLTASWQKFCQQRMKLRVHLSDGEMEYLIDPWGGVQEKDKNGEWVRVSYNAATIKKTCSDLKVKITVADLLPLDSK